MCRRSSCCLRLVITRPMTAPSFELRDTEGRVRARLAMKGQNPTLELFTASGTTTLELKGPRRRACYSRTLGHLQAIF